MKRTAVTALLSSYLFLAPIQFQYNATASPQYRNQEEMRILKEEKLQNLKEKIQEEGATRAAQLNERRKERIRYFFNIIIKKFQAYAQRLDKLSERIESRLARIEAGEENIDTSSARVQMNETRLLLDETSDQISVVSQSLELVLESNDPKTAFAVVRVELNEIKNSLKTVHANLVEIITEIKGLRAGNSTG